MQPKGYSFLVNYKNIKKKREEFLKKRFSGICKFYSKGSQKRQFTRTRKAPWYMLTSGKQYNYEERKIPGGAHTGYFRVDSEMKELAKKTSILRGVRGECKLELYTKHKINKWIKRNTKPCDDRDLFADQYLPEWENRKKEAEIQIQNHLSFLYKKEFRFDSKLATILHVKRDIYRYGRHTLQTYTNVAYQHEYCRGNDIIYVCNIKPNELVTVNQIVKELKKMFLNIKTISKPLKMIFQQKGINIIVNKDGTTKCCVKGVRTKKFGNKNYNKHYSVWETNKQQR